MKRIELRLLFFFLRRRVFVIVLICFSAKESANARNCFYKLLHPFSKKTPLTLTGWGSPRVGHAETTQFDDGLYYTRFVSIDGKVVGIISDHRPEESFDMSELSFFENHTYIKNKLRDKTIETYCAKGKKVFSKKNRAYFNKLLRNPRSADLLSRKHLAQCVGLTGMSIVSSTAGYMAVKSATRSIKDTAAGGAIYYYGSNFYLSLPIMAAFETCSKSLTGNLSLAKAVALSAGVLLTPAEEILYMKRNTPAEWEKADVLSGLLGVALYASLSPHIFRDEAARYLALCK